MDINTTPRYSARNLCQWRDANGNYDYEHDHWAVIETVGQKLGDNRVFEEYGIQPRHAGMDFAPEHKRARQRAAELNQASFDANIAGQKFTRYLTFSYVAVDLEECKRHAGIDKTRPDKIHIAPNVGILHYADTWMLWDDGKFTTGIGIHLPLAGSLTKAAQALIATVRGADGGGVELPGGMLALTKLDAILSEAHVEIGPSRGHYAAEKIEHLHVRWLDGSEGDLYAVTAGYFEGYRYDIFPTLAAARAEFGLSPETGGMTAFPADDFDYDQRLGYVSKDA